MGTETRDSGGRENPFHNRIGNLRPSVKLFIWIREWRGWQDTSMLWNSVPRSNKVWAGKTIRYLLELLSSFGGRRVTGDGHSETYTKETVRIPDRNCENPWLSWQDRRKQERNCSTMQAREDLFHDASVFLLKDSGEGRETAEDLVLGGLVGCIPDSSWLVPNNPWVTVHSLSMWRSISVKAFLAFPGDEIVVSKRPFSVIVKFHYARMGQCSCWASPSDCAWLLLH